MNSLQWLQQWYYAHCDDTWEHQHGITIQSLDNPGWLVKIDLAGTPLESVNMKTVGQESHINHSGITGDHDWLYCKVEDGFFVGAGEAEGTYHLADGHSRVVRPENASIFILVVVEGHPFAELFLQSAATSDTAQLPDGLLEQVGVVVRTPAVA
jgi:hypothetical protein